LSFSGQAGWTGLLQDADGTGQPIASLKENAMSYFRYSFLVTVSLLFCSSLFGQGTSSGATASCNFNSRKQVAVEYQRMTVDVKKPVFGEEIPYDKVWAPAANRWLFS
jgi:hypothetical protein